MKLISLLLLPVLACCGCGLLGDFRNQTFDTGKQVVRLKVPRGYHDRDLQTDSAGNLRLVYRYPFGASLYFGTDTVLSAFIDTAQHIPRPPVTGGRFYKGMLPQWNVWREVYSQGLKYGYRNVHRDDEALFDSSLNYLRLR